MRDFVIIQMDINFINEQLKEVEPGTKEQRRLLNKKSNLELEYDRALKEQWPEEWRARQQWEEVQERYSKIAL